jgi:hypothetical protein
MTPYSPAKPRGRLVEDPATGRWHVEWSAVEKAADDDEQPIRFQKDTVVSGKKRESLKRAKERKDRLMAEIAAQQHRENLNKGDDMKEPLITLAKAMIENNYTPKTTTKLSFWKALTALSEKNRQPGQSREQSFAKVIATEPGSLLYRGYRLARTAMSPPAGTVITGRTTTTCPKRHPPTTRWRQRRASSPASSGSRSSGLFRASTAKTVISPKWTRRITRSGSPNRWPDARCLSSIKATSSRVLPNEIPEGRRANLMHQSPRPHLSRSVPSRQSQRPQKACGGCARRLGRIDWQGNRSRAMSSCSAA